MSYTAGNVMDSAASLLNDTPRELYSYAVQLPYLKIAQQELEQTLILNGATIDLISEPIINVAIGAVTLTLPSDFFLPIRLQERLSGDTIFSPMTEVADINGEDRASNDSLSVWDFRNNAINFVAPLTARQVRLTYWKNLAAIVNETSNEPIIGANNSLSFRTAALCALYIGGNKDRSDELNLEAMAARDLLISLLVKNNQGTRTRRKPFRVNYKSL